MSKSASVRTRKRGKKWSYIFEAGKTAEGKRKVVEKGGYSTKQAAYDAGVAAYTDWKHGNIGITSEKITVKDFIKNWLENVVAMNVKPTSMQKYQSVVKLHIFSKLGNLKLTDLTPAILDNWMRKLQKTGYSKSTLSSAHAILNQALDYAVYPSELIQSNPASYIKVPKKAPTNIVKRQIISQEQLSALLEKYPFGSPFYIPILILFHTGLRIGELLGLMWEDIDFKTKTINLSRQILYISKRGNFFSTLKTQSSNRYIIIDDFLISELKRWKLRQSENEKNFGKSYVYIYKTAEGKIFQQSKSLENSNEKVNLICTKENGFALSRGLLSKLFKQNGLNAHSFRHTHATILIENGATPRGVASRLGHVDATITQNLYTHNTRKLQEDIATIFAKNLQTKS